MEKATTSTTSKAVAIQVVTESNEEFTTVTAAAAWVGETGDATAKAVRLINNAQAAQLSNAVSLESIIDTFKRDALRELVTQLSIHGVL